MNRYYVELGSFVLSTEASSPEDAAEALARQMGEEGIAKVWELGEPIRVSVHVDVTTERRSA